MSYPLSSLPLKQHIYFTPVLHFTTIPQDNSTLSISFFESVPFHLLHSARHFHIIRPDYPSRLFLAFIPRDKSSHTKRHTISSGKLMLS